jgi:hypothetical protein
MRKQHSWASQDNMDGLFWEVQGSELPQTHMDIEHTLSLSVSACQRCPGWQLYDPTRHPNNRQQARERLQMEF